jgi:hypothetical protein
MELSRREVVVAALGACLLAIVMTWPLLIHVGDVVPRDIGDPLAEAWQPAWGGHALIHQPLHYFDANRFWPLKDSLAFGDALIGYAPTGIIGRGPHAAMVRYDLLFLFAYALAFFGAYLLARELGLSPAGAAIAGAAFAFAPYRLEQDGHLQVISSGGIPLAIAFAVRGIRLKRPWWLFWAWVVAAWQVSAGPSPSPWWRGSSAAGHRFRGRCSWPGPRARSSSSRSPIGSRTRTSTSPTTSPLRGEARTRSRPSPVRSRSCSPLRRRTGSGARPPRASATA